MDKMNITFAQYLKNMDGVVSSIRVIIDGTTLGVPLDPANRHFTAIMKAVEDGELVIQPAEGGA